MPLAPVPDRLRRTLPPGGTTTRGGFEIDLTEALTAPTVEQAPVSRGMLLAQQNLFAPGGTDGAIRPGQPYLMTQSGAWRQLDLERYGFGAVAYSELSMAISPDGVMVALADPSGVVTIDLSDTAFRRFDLPVQHAVAMEWSADGATLVFRDRNGTRQCGPNGCALDVTTGGLTEVPYDAFFATQGVDGQAFEVVDRPGSRPTRVVIHREGEAPTSVDVDHSTAPSTAGGPVAATHVAFAQCPSGRRSRDTDGVVVVDPSDGAVLAMLAAPRREGQCILGAQTWLTERNLLVSDWVEGDLWSWDVTTGRVLRVATSPINGLNVSVAGEVLVRRIS